MNKTISITISGQLFHIEEEAYKRLDEYLRSIRQHFSTFEGHEEIVADIEARIAEHFEERLTGKQVLSVADVDDLILNMGTVNDFAEFEGEGGKQDREEERKRTKKLYRDPDDKILGGVAAGLAAYFGLDTTLVRLIFVVAVLTGGWGILLYLILWIVTPEASTTAEKAHMRGEPVTLSSIEQKIRSAMPKRDGADNGLKKKLVEPPLNLIARLFNWIAEVIRVIVPFIGKVIGFCVTLGASIALFFLTFGFITFMVNADSQYVDFPLQSIVAPTVFYAVSIAGLIAVFVPLLFILLVGSSLLKGRSAFSTTVVGSLIALWITALMVGGVTAFSVAPEYREKWLAQESTRVETDKLFEITEFNNIELSNGFRVNVQQGDAFAVSASGDMEELDHLRIFVENGVLRAEREAFDRPWRLCFFCFRNRQVTLDVTAPTLQGISAENGTSIRAEGFTLEALTLSARNGSRLEVIADATTIDADVSSGSRLILNGNSEQADLRLSNGSRIEWTGGVNRVKTDISSASRLILEGTGNDLNAKVYNGSVLDAIDFISQTATVNASSASSAHVHATTKLDLRATNGSRIDYADTGIVPTKEVSTGSRIQVIGGEYYE